MKYAKKIIVYPPARSDPLTDKINELDNEMSNILTKKGINVYEKIKLYNDFLAKTLAIENQYKNRFAEDESPHTGIEVPKEIIKQEPVPKKYQPEPAKIDTEAMDITIPPETPKQKKQKRKLDITMPLVDTRGKDVTNVFHKKRVARKKRLEKGYNRSNKISKQQANQLQQAWEEFERENKRNPGQWIPIEKFDRGVTTRAKKQKVTTEEKFDIS